MDAVKKLKSWELKVFLLLDCKLQFASYEMRSNVINELRSRGIGVVSNDNNVRFI